MGCCGSKQVAPENEPDIIRINDLKKEDLKDKNEIELKKKAEDEENKFKRKDQQKDDEQKKAQEIEHKENELKRKDQQKIDEQKKVQEIEDLSKKKKLDEDAEIDEIKNWINRVQDLLSTERLMKYVLDKKRTDFGTVEELANYFKKGPANNNLELYWMIFVWIAENITYNTIGYKSGNFGNNDALNVLRTGLAVCAGFSNLFDAVCKVIVLDCVNISGYAKGIGYTIGEKFSKTNHAWNAIKVNEKWFYLDATWAGRKSNDSVEIKDLSPYWFMTPPNIFLESHYSPEMKLHRKCTKEEFENLHYYELEYYVIGLKNNFVKSSTIVCNSSPFFIEFTSLEDLDLLVKLKEGEKEIPNSIIYQKDTSSTPIKHGIIIFTEVKNKEYTLEIFGRSADSTEAGFNFFGNLSLKREGVEKNVKIPDYNIFFMNNKIKLLSHKSSLIYYDSDPLILEFSAPISAKILANLSHMNSANTIEKSVLVQKNPKNSNILIYVLSPEAKKRMILKLFSTEKDEKSVPFVGDLQLFKTNEITTIEKGFVTKYSTEYEFFIHEPIQFYLKLNQTYKFKFYVQKAIAVILEIENGHQVYLDRNENEENIYEIEYAPNALGKLTFWAKYDYGSNLAGLCYYEVKN